MDQHLDEEQELIEPKKRHRFITKSCLFTNNDELEPFKKFNINSTQILDDINERFLCPKCKKSRRYYCYSCYVPVISIKNHLPVVQLPVKVDIIKHAKEVDGKSTSAHAAILCPNDVRIFIYPEIPVWDNDKVILVFPGPRAKSLCELLSSHCTSTSYSDLPFNKIVFIDSTWRQTKRIYNDERMKHLPTVLLNSHKSLFWRHQRNKPESYLATIEAIYYFFVDLHETINSNDNTGECSQISSYDGRYDNLLFFFKHTYNRLKKLYKSDEHFINDWNHIELKD